MSHSTPDTSLHSQMALIAEKARSAKQRMRSASTAIKNKALQLTAEALQDQASQILAANKQDTAQAAARGLPPAMADRLMLNQSRLHDIIDSLNTIIALEDPVGKKITSTERPNGLSIERVRTPIGVIAVIYESRPNVTIDAGALCLKSGNVAILRGGSEAFATSQALNVCLQQGLSAAGLPEGAIQLVQTTDRAAVGEILAGLNGAIDLIIPRGGKSLVARVQEEARAPVLSHLDGVCHVYVDRDANVETAVSICVNAKMRRTGVCGAMESLLIDRAILPAFTPVIVQALQEAGCKLKADQEVRQFAPHLEPATEEDFYTEYLEATLSIAAVDGVDGAIDHIQRYSSAHTDSIVTENQHTADKFLTHVDSAIVMHNASTQFADGGEFGLGAEIGIATGRLHARGPVGLEELTTYKNVVRGVDHIRP